jgi:hypothetical protein
MSCLDVFAGTSTTVPVQRYQYNGTSTTVPVQRYQYNASCSDVFGTSTMRPVLIRCRYQYSGVGETAIWHSSKNYLVVDLAAGPTTYGPLVSQGGAVTPQGLPSIKVSVA